MLDKGTTLAGYRIDGVLGQGGMGVVYEATQLSLDRRVALKLLATHLGEDALFRERFRREALIQANIDHPHIVTVFEAGESDEGLFMAMRMVRGPNLKDMIIARQLDAGRALRILKPIAEALDSAHEAGLIHRDIKPQNILVSGRDHAYLADFGLTKAPGEKSLTKTGQFVGTLDYISPEQIRGLKATTKSDIYALAAVLYECLIGVVPFPKDSEAAVLFAHMSDPPPKVTDHRPELPGELDDVIAKAMSKDPEERPASAGELLRDAELAFDRRLRAAISPPGPLDSPEEAGIRKGEGDVRTRESKVRDTGELIGEGATRLGGPDVTKLGGVEATNVAATAAGETALAGAADPTKVGTAGDATQARGAGDATRLGTAAGGGAVAAPPARTAARPGGGALAGIAAGVVALAVIGFVLGSSGGGSDEPAGSNSASAGAVKLSYPDSWEESAEPVAVPGLELRDAIALSPAGAGEGGLIAGQASATGALLLPSALLERLADRPSEGDPVKLGELEALRYEGLQPEGLDGEATVYAVPNAGGVATVACVGPSGAEAASFQSGCATIAASLELRDVEPVPLGPSQAYADALNAAVGTLNSQRAAARSTLRSARTPDGQSRAAGQLQGAYRTAARSLSRAEPGPAAQEANAGIVKALQETSSAYGRLASAARRGDRGAYGAARRAATNGESAVRRAIGKLAELGYSVG